jgi:hypothetical protein
MKTCINPATVPTLRARLETAQYHRWMDGAAVILYGAEHGDHNGELNAVPAAYLTDISYTENPEVVTTVELDDIAELLEMDDESILGFVQGIYSQQSATE